MLKISKLADYATVIMNNLALHTDQVFSAAELASRTHLSVPTVSKVLKLLLEAQLVVSTRGAEGGYRLARAAEQINMAEVITAIDGQPAMTECSVKAKVCVQDSVCAVRNNWQLINKIILTVLQSLSLADMTQPLAQHPLVTQGISRIMEQAK